MTYSMKRTILLTLLCAVVSIIQAQNTLSLAECRRLALENNRQLKISALTKDIAANTHKAAKTQYLPQVNGLAGYEHTSREISLLNKKQKNALSNLGTNSIGSVGTQISQGLSNLVQQGFISTATAQQLGQVLGNLSAPLAQAGNNIGNTIKDAFRSDTKNIYSAGIIVSQPIYMGGAIKAANDMAAIGEQMADNNISLKRQNILFAVDNAYWLAVSLKKKEQLATSFRDLAQKLDNDVHKMIRAGVATKADGLKVDVAVNTADMQITKIQSGVSLAKMALCELCGIDLNSDIILEDESHEDIAVEELRDLNTPVDSTIRERRPELRLLQNTIELSKQNTKLVRSFYLPHVLLTGGYSVSNPNLFNGFQKKFTDLWNIGIVVHVPIWNWGQGKYKVRAAQAATSVAGLELEDAEKMINLEVEQYRFRLKDANKQLSTAKQNMHAAEENLRCANVGFKEGVMTVTDVMTAQTAWQTAKTAIIDAEIEVRLAQTGLQKALGHSDFEK